MEPNTQPSAKPTTAVKPDFELKLPKNRKETEFFNIGIKELDEATYLAMDKLVSNGKELDATKMLLKNLRVSGDSADDIIANFISLRSASQLLLQIVRPVEGELKKN